MSNDGYARTPLGLRTYMRDLSQKKVAFTEVTYVVNTWRAVGIIKFEHHSIVLKATNSDYMTLDFARKGLTWDREPEDPKYPGEIPYEIPSNSIKILRFLCDITPKQVADYTKDLPRFNPFVNNCETFAVGFMRKYVDVDVNAKKYDNVKMPLV